MPSAEAEAADDGEAVSAPAAEPSTGEAALVPYTQCNCSNSVVLLSRTIDGCGTVCLEVLLWAGSLTVLHQKTRRHVTFVIAITAINNHT